jgi:DNA-binding NtrC family response regulator
MSRASRVLCVDDSADDRALLVRALRQVFPDFEVVEAAGGVEALDQARRQLFDVALVDVRMPGMGGLEVLTALRAVNPAIEVVMVTGAPDVRTAVEALKAGASDYLGKPVNADELRHRLERLLEERFLRQEVDDLRSRAGVERGAAELVGTSPAMDALRELIARVAGADSPVLIEGESGTGKELVAATIHRRSPRHAGPFVPVNCGAVPAELMESEFFGHVRGAFSGAVADTVGLFRSAHRGTLFLDELTELPAALQVKLLRVLQEREVRPVGTTRSHPVDVRVVAATNRRLDEALRDRVLREDLFYRLNVVRVAVPPLREHRADIPGLVMHVVRKLNARFGREVRAVSAEAMAALTAYEFPGNVRELENLLERAYVLGARGELTAADLPPLGPAAAALGSAPPRPASPAGTPAPASEAPGAELPSLPETLARIERDLIARALQLHGGDKVRAARALGMSARTLYRRLRQLGFSP